MPTWIFDRKTWMLLGALALLAWAYIAVTDYGADRYQAGYDARVAEEHDATVSADAENAERYARQLAEALAQRTRERDTARELAADLQNREPETVTHEIIKVVETGPCDRVGADVLRVLNDSVGTEPTTENR